MRDEGAAEAFTSLLVTANISNSPQADPVSIRFGGSDGFA
jgi:hypothetical protein